MLIVLRQDASEADVAAVVAAVTAMGYEARPLAGAQRTAVGVLGNEGRVDTAGLSVLPGVLEIIHVTRPYKQVSREWHPERTVIRLTGGVTIGGDEVVVIAGPCAVESERQILAAATHVRQAGASLLRAGAYKPRSSPYAFQGLGDAGLRLLARAREETGLLIVTEALDTESVERVAEVADVVQIGARNMHNHALLRRAGRLGKPVLLKRSPAATIEELLLAAEYIVAEGNGAVILCERGVRSFDGATRNLLDLSAVPVVQRLSHLPIVVDPSHGTGHRDLVPPMARAAAAAGADGLMIEVHPEPETARSDGAQSLYPEQFERTMRDIRTIVESTGRRLAGSARSAVLRAGAALLLAGAGISGFTVLAAPAAAQQAPDADALIGRAARTYQSLTSLRADFEQVIADRMVGTFSAKGTLIQAGNNKLSMRFSDPAGDAIIVDGEYVWLYTPSTTPGQVIRSPVPTGGPVYGYNLLAWFLDRPRERYEAKYVRRDEVGGRAVDVVELTPLNPEMPFRRAVVAIDRTDALPRRLEITERSGATRTVTLTNLRPNAPAPADAFRFDVPRGVRVVER